MEINNIELNSGELFIKRDDDTLEKNRYGKKYELFYHYQKI